MMDEQSKFKEALASVTIRAEENGGKLSAEEAKELLKDMEVNDEQMSMIYAYLASKGYVVEGAVLPEKEQEPYTEEEEEFLEQYRKDMKSMRRQTEEVLQELFSAALAGEQEAIRLLTEHYMEKVLAVAEEYAHRGMLIQDLIQEGNIGLLMGLHGAADAEHGELTEDYLEREIRKTIRAAMDEQSGETRVGEEVTGKLNKLADSITELTEDLGREVSPEELSVFLDMPLDEIEDLLRIAGDTIEVDRQEQK